MIFPRKSRMPVRVRQRLLEHFVAGTTARATAQLVGVQGRSVVVLFQRLRQVIATTQESFLLSGEIEADESYFGGVRQEKCLSLGCEHEAARCTRRSSRMPKPRH